MCFTRVLHPLRSVERAGFHFFPKCFSQADDLKLTNFIPQEFSTLNMTLRKYKFWISPDIAGKPHRSVSFLNWFASGYFSLYKENYSFLKALRHINR